MLVSKAMKVFMTLAEEKDLKKTAQRLCLTMPPVTRMLKITEEWYGDKLFTISRCTVKLTPAGEYLYNKIQLFYHEINNLNKKQSKSLSISSPIINSPYIYQCLKRLSFEKKLNIAIKCMDEISSEDSVFIGFNDFHHKQFRRNMVIIPLFLIIKDSERLSWKDKDIYISNQLLNTDTLNNFLKKIKEQGYKGRTIIIDNNDFRMELFRRGEVLLIKDYLTISEIKNAFIIDKYDQPTFIFCNINHHYNGEAIDQIINSFKMQNS